MALLLGMIGVTATAEKIDATATAQTDRNSGSASSRETALTM